MHIILHKATAYVKSYGRETKWIYFLIDVFLIDMMTYCNNMILFGIKSVLILKKNLKSILSIIKII